MTRGSFFRLRNLAAENLLPARLLLYRQPASALRFSQGWTQLGAPKKALRPLKNLHLAEALGRVLLRQRFETVEDSLRYSRSPRDRWPRRPPFVLHCPQEQIVPASLLGPMPTQQPAELG